MYFPFNEKYITKFLPLYVLFEITSLLVASALNTGHLFPTKFLAIIFLKKSV